MNTQHFTHTLNVSPAKLPIDDANFECILLFNANALKLNDFNLSDYLSTFELTVINKRKSPQAKQEYLATRLLLKYLARCYLKSSSPHYTNLPFNIMCSRFNTQSNKLQLHIKNDCVINACISHSHGFVGVALNVLKSEFGFDIEKINLTRPINKLAKHFYHVDEIALLNQSCDNNRQANTFFRLWTLKEALAKATSRPIAQLLSPNVFNELTQSKLVASSDVVSQSNMQAFDISVVSKKSTHWQCFLLNDDNLRHVITLK